MNFTCPICNKQFTDSDKRKYCSKQCQTKGITKPNEERLCSCGCGAKLIRKRFSKLHPKSYVRGHQFKGKLNYNWKSGRYTATESGYVFVNDKIHPNADRRGYVREHIKIMTEFIGRALCEGEVVHHKNGNKQDNRIENLELMKLEDHLSLHHKGVIKPNSIKNLKPRKKQVKPTPARRCGCGCGTLIQRQYFNPKYPISYIRNHHIRGDNNPKRKLKP